MARMVYLVIPHSSSALWQNSDTGFLVTYFVHMKLHPVIYRHSACNRISVLLVFSRKISPLRSHSLRVNLILQSSYSWLQVSLLQFLCSQHLNYMGYESVLAYTEGKGTEKSGGCAHRTYIRLMSCYISTISCNRKAHSFNMLNGGSINEIVNHKILVQWVLRVQYKYATVGSIYFFDLLIWIHFKLL